MRTIKWYTVLGAIGVLLALGGRQGVGQEVPDWVTRTKLSGLVFGDLYWMANNHDSAVEDKNGFWFRRIYLTADHTLNDRLAFRVRFEMNSPGDFENADKLDPFVKDAWIRIKFKREDLYIGISPTPTFDLVEKAWRYRPVEKSPLDLFKIGSSRDFGVSLKGRFDEGGKVHYHAMFGNGSGTKGETNEGKKGALSVTYYPSPKFLIQAYGDFEQRPEDTERGTQQLFVAWQGERGSAGILAARQTRQVTDGETLNIEVASVFGTLKVSEDVALLARYDRSFDPLPDGAKIAFLPLDPTARVNFFLAGVDFTLFEKFHIIPNIEAVVYDGVGEAESPDSDVMLRTTFFANF